MINQVINVAKGLQELEVTESGVYTVQLVEAGAELQLKGAFLAKNQDKVDVTVIIHHQAPHTRANTVLKGVAQDQGQVRFVGRIIIDEECGDSNSFLTERILLLSDKAKAEAIPDLEIKTDDVKCSHAASISHIPHEHLFYLMSRGLPKSEAEALIIEGFLD
ncbi:MAG: SufD family Fe-S cluster assembly protein [bacterium]|nr:SufD family Fe-S cluster assembly protein [bacterium]